jgi:4-amino-4-deoxy-L-arabinose transferase-like glycosyltransferase
MHLEKRNRTLLPFWQDTIAGWKFALPKTGRSGTFPPPGSVVVRDDIMNASVREAGARWWREWEVGLLLLLVAAIYFSRLTTLPLRGEETRRAMVAREILWTGDWIVPLQQGEPFLSRPPLGSYPIAWLGMLLGEVTPLATRLPTAIATLLTTLLIYGYSRQVLSRVGALGAAISYATMGQVLQLGQLAETEATFTLLVAGSLLLWHAGYLRGCSPYVYWSIAYLCVALGALAKGPQAPVYFAATIGVYLIFRRQWKQLLQPAHFVGIGVFAVVLGAWQIPFAMRLGWDGVRDVWASDVGLRFVDQTWLTLLEHLVVFPVEIWVCLLPASLLLLAYFRPSFWRGIAPHYHWVSFLVIAIAVTFPTCWFVPGAKARYYMPLYPCFAPLAGLVIDELLQAAPSIWLVALWKHYQRLLLAVAGGVCVATIVLATVPQFEWTDMRQSPVLVAFLSVACLGVVAWLWSAMRQLNERGVRKTLVAASLLLAVTYTGLVINLTNAQSLNIQAEVQAIKNDLLADSKLVSFGIADHVFMYHYGDPIELLPVPKQASDVPADVEHFCLLSHHGEVPKLPFAWEQKAVVSCDRFASDTPTRIMIVGRRLPTSVASAETETEAKR